MLKPLKVLFFIVILVTVISCQPETTDPEDPPEEPPEEIEEPVDVYEVFEMEIQVENNAPVISKDKADYLNCSVTINGRSIFDDYLGTARIRGRGNSSWLWYDKKPYRIKLDKSSEILGLKKNKDWVLLANYRDPTNLMNVFCFDVAQWLGLPFSNHTRFVEVTLNGDFIGLYQLTEQVEQGGSRVDVDDDDGWLISLDADDGPYLSPDNEDNFWSTVFRMPVCVKYPDDPTSSQLSTIKRDFARLELAIRNRNYNSVAALMDIPSYINYLILQELVYNVEIGAPRSVYIHKDKNGKYTMGPAWDFDGGFDFDWDSMYTGHNFFNEQQLVLGTDPARHTNGARVPGFFTQLFSNNQFVQEYKDRWNEVKDSIFEHSWQKMENYALCLQDAMARDFERWPIDKDYNTEIDRMEDWLSHRVSYLTSVINDYPGGTDLAEKK